MTITTIPPPTASRTVRPTANLEIGEPIYSQAISKGEGQHRTGQYLAASKGSSVFAVLSATLLVTAASLDDRSIGDQLPQLWQPMLMIVWLLFASFLIAKAHTCARKFEQTAGKQTGEVDNASWLSQEHPVVSHWSIITGVSFAMLGVVICWFMELSNTEAALLWKWSWTCVVASTFYYAGFGIWGSWMVTRQVADYAEYASRSRLINECHGDGLGGLGFVRYYADTATIFMASGIVAFPMGILLGKFCLKMNSVAGNILAAMIALAILIWGVFSLSAALSGRIAVARAIRKHRNRLLDELAAEKRSIISGEWSAERSEILRIKEVAVERLNCGVLTGAGAWKDIFAFSAMIWSLLVYANAIDKQFDFGIF